MAIERSVARNISDVLARADDVDWHEGVNAYYSYRETMRGLAGYYGYSLSQVAATFAALSPNNDYIKNLRSTATLLKGHASGIPVEDLTTTSYRACQLRAWRVLNGEDFLSFTKGKKTRNFYELIIDPDHPSAIAIDGHMISVYSGRRMTMTEVVNLRPRFNYDAVAFEFRRIAFQEFLRPSQLQAILWFTWKRINRIVYDGNYSLFDNSDQWKMRWLPEDVKPYYI